MLASKPHVLMLYLYFQVRLDTVVIHCISIVSDSKALGGLRLGVASQRDMALSESHQVVTTSRKGAKRSASGKLCRQNLFEAEPLGGRTLFSSPLASS